MILDFKYEVIALDAAADAALLYASWYGLKCLMLEQYNGVKIAVSKEWFYESSEFYELFENFNTERINNVASDQELLLAHEAGFVQGCYLGGYTELGNWFTNDDIPDRLTDLAGEELLNYLIAETKKSRFKVWPVKNDFYYWINKIALEDRQGLRYEIGVGGSHIKVNESPEGDDFGVEIMSLLKSTVYETVPYGVVNVDRTIGNKAAISSEAFKNGVNIEGSFETYLDTHYIKAGVKEDDIIFSGGRPFDTFGNLNWLRSFSSRNEISRNEPFYLSLLMNMIPVVEWVNVVVWVNRLEETDTIVIPATYADSTIEVTTEWDEDTFEFITVETEVPGEMLTPERIVFDPLYFLISGNETALKLTDVVTINAGYEALGLSAYDSEENPIYKWNVFLIGEDGKRISPISTIYLDQTTSSNNAVDIVWLNGLGGWSNIRGMLISEMSDLSAELNEWLYEDLGDVITHRRSVTAIEVATVELSIENDAFDSLNDLIHSERVFFYESGSLISVRIDDRTFTSDEAELKVDKRVLRFFKSKMKVGYGLE